MTTVHIPYTVEQAVRMVIEDDGIPVQLQRSLDLDIA
jgi:hypothetical protein